MFFVAQRSPACADLEEALDGFGGGANFVELDISLGDGMAVSRDFAVGQDYAAAVPVYRPQISGEGIDGDEKDITLADW
jgi:hypothetical protein